MVPRYYLFKWMIITKFVPVLLCTSNSINKLPASTRIMVDYLISAPEKHLHHGKHVREGVISKEAILVSLVRRLYVYLQKLKKNLKYRIHNQITMSFSTQTKKLSFLLLHSTSFTMSPWIHLQNQKCFHILTESILPSNLTTIKSFETCLWFWICNSLHIQPWNVQCTFNFSS